MSSRWLWLELVNTVTSPTMSSRPRVMAMSNSMSDRPRRVSRGRPGAGRARMVSVQRLVEGRYLERGPHQTPLGFGAVQPIGAVHHRGKGIRGSLPGDGDGIGRGCSVEHDAAARVDHRAD